MTTKRRLKRLEARRPVDGPRPVTTLEVYHYGDDGVVLTVEIIELKRVGRP